MTLRILLSRLFLKVSNTTQKTIYATGGFVESMKIKNFHSAANKQYIKQVMVDKPSGFIMRHPFKNEWIIKN